MWDRMDGALFDFDGTLAVLNIDFAQMREQVLEICVAFGLPIADLGSLYVLEMINAGRLILEERDRDCGERFYREAHRSVESVEMDAAAHSTLVPGAAELLTRLREGTKKVGIVTRNCEKAVQAVLASSHLPYDLLLARDHVEKVKPDPAHLTEALERLRLQARRALMVGDHPLDILAGKRVGMWTAGVLTGNSTTEKLREAGANWIVQSVSELAEL